MKYIACILLLLIISGNLVSQEINKLSDEIDSSLTDNHNDIIDIDFNVSLKFIFPLIWTEDQSLIFFNISAGIGLGIIPGYYYIGITGDVAIGLDWISLFSDDREPDKELTQFGFSLGGRIYNLIKIVDFSIRPFFGCDFMFVVIPMPYIGLEIAYKKIGIEYANYIPIGNNIHQISIKIRL